MAEHPFARVVRVARAGSTNTDLGRAVQAAPHDWPHLSVLVAEHQEAGRGRSGRAWETPPGTALTASVLLRPRVAPERLSSVTLVVGLAVQRALAALTGRALGLKWPNDVLAQDQGEDVDGWGRDRKVAGILTETVPGLGGTPAVVVGIGVNVAQSGDELPVPWATSLALLGSTSRPTTAAGPAPATPSAAARTPAAPAAPASPPGPTPEDVLTAVGQELVPLLDRWERADPTITGEIAAACVTLGQDVRVDRPGQPPLHGRAVALGPDGSLQVRTPAGETRTVLAGDVRHARKGPAGGV